MSWSRRIHWPEICSWNSTVPRWPTKISVRKKHERYSSTSELSNTLKYTQMKPSLLTLSAIAILIIALAGCGSPDQRSNGALSSNAATRTYIAPGEYDEFYGFLSGGFSGQLSVYGLPSGRLLKVIPVFSQDPEKAYGYNEETKPMLETTFGFIPWD